MYDFFEKYDHQLMWEPNTGCCIWIGAQTSEGSDRDVGYGHGTRDGVHFYAHRAALACTLGRPLVADALHHCDFPPCCNPDHLFEGDAKANAADMLAKGRHRCTPRPGLLHHAAIITPVDAAYILSSTKTGRALAAELGVGFSTISRIRTGKHWTNG